MEEESFRQIMRKRLLDDILKTASQSSDGDWNILVLDKFTLKVFSSACTMSEMIDCGVSLIEEIEKGREPMPSTAGIYFIEPEPASVAQLIKDFSNEKLPQYASAHVFFSSSFLVSRGSPITKLGPKRGPVAVSRSFGGAYHLGPEEGL
ncbi:Sec1-like domain containing protein [Cymbomonas tetramitiformis]|uniref:Sec1-like domain containing protein n=1 Tax=Cymbomonas tetramitiformis TaxID=36881 RepID=A0AAE0BVT9_9CHLO|nr:Sec1-like domain containing protein [Cymbomonas tetramitiformis]